MHTFYSYILFYCAAKTEILCDLLVLISFICGFMLIKRVSIWYGMYITIYIITKYQIRNNIGLQYRVCDDISCYWIKIGRQIHISTNQIWAKYSSFVVLAFSKTFNWAILFSATVSDFFHSSSTHWIEAFVEH